MESYQDVLDSDPSQSLKTALNLIEAGEPQNGRRLLERIVERYPDQPEPYGHLAWAWLKEGRSDKAISLYQRLLELEPENNQASLLLARCYAQTGQNQKACELLDSIKNLSDDAFITSQVTLINLLTGRSNWTEGIQTLLDLGPGCALTTAFDFIQSGRYEEGHQLFEEIVERYPDHNETYGHIAWAWLSKGKPEKSIPFYQRLFEKHPEDKMARVLLARCFAQSGQTQRADELITALDTSSEDSFLIYQVILTLFWSGRISKALNLFKTSDRCNRPEVRRPYQLFDILTSLPTGYGIRRNWRRIKSFFTDPKPPRNPSIILVLCPRLSINVGYPPIGAARLAAALSKQDLPPWIMDVNLELLSSSPRHWQALWNQEAISLWVDSNIVRMLLFLFKAQLEKRVDRIAASPCRLVGLSVFDNNREFSIEVARMIRKKAPDKLIIFGGPDCYPVERCEKIFPCDVIDGFVLGEGEQTLLEIVRRVQANDSLENISGLWLSQSPPTEFIEVQPVRPLSSLPLPTYKEFKIGLQSSRIFFLELCRGCVARCDFCMDRLMWPGFRLGSPEDVAKQVANLVQQFGGRYFSFVDFLVNAHIPSLEKLCDCIIESGISASFTASCRVNPKMTDDLFRKMKQAGFTFLFYGIESGTDTVLQAMNKGITVVEIERCLRMTREAGIETGIFLIVGHPVETETEFQETLDFLSRNRDIISRVEAVNVCALHKISVLTQNARKYGVCNPENSGGWFSENGNTLEVRNRRRTRLLEHVHELGISTGFQLTPQVLESEASN